MFFVRSAFWLGLAFLVIQPFGINLAASANRLGSAAIESGRTAALSGLDQVECKTFECAGARLVAQSVLTPKQPDGTRVMTAPYPSPPLVRNPS